MFTKLFALISVIGFLSYGLYVLTPTISEKTWQFSDISYFFGSFNFSGTSTVIFLTLFLACVLIDVSLFVVRKIQKKAPNA